MADLKTLSLSAMAALWLGAPAFAGCEGRVYFDDLTYDVEIVADNASRGKGLMHRESMPDDEGMLFVFEHDLEQRFWMRNTLIALDILFFRNDGRLNNVVQNAVPQDETLLPGYGALVLELNAGEYAENEGAFKKLKFRLTDRTRCPQIVLDHPMRVKFIK